MSFLMVTVAGDEIDQMVIKVFKKNTGTLLPPALSLQSQTAIEIDEKKRTWKLEAKTAYMIEIEYAGDLYDKQMEEEPCSYFDMTISINSMKSLGEKLSCTNPQIAQAPSFMTSLPKEIKDRDLDFKMNGLYTLRYPSDFM